MRLRNISLFKTAQAGFAISSVDKRVLGFVTWRQWCSMPRKRSGKENVAICLCRSSNSCIRSPAQWKMSLSFFYSQSWEWGSVHGARPENRLKGCSPSSLSLWFRCLYWKPPEIREPLSKNINQTIIPFAEAALTLKGSWVAHVNPQGISTGLLSTGSLRVTQVLQVWVLTLYLYDTIANIKVSKWHC